MATKNTATESVLGDLHAKVAKVMVSTLDYFEQAAEVYDAKVEAATTAEELPITERPIPAPALLAAMTKFLSDNKITCAPEDSSELSDLEARLKAKKARKLKVVGGVDMNPDED